ncbi:hypothetical protein C8J56DRAFT_854635 [Mycena floridula]|nr:hypothetical protein C8J56DRAFT_854635 [Mycena floridula]
MSRISDLVHGPAAIGQGRRRDSISSNESTASPKKPSFSPAGSDDDEADEALDNGATYPADDDTPPPERPLLRQPVGFAWNAPSTITAPTYEASLATPTAFLPGQQVHVPAPPAPTPAPAPVPTPAASVPPPAKPKRKPRTRKPKPDEYVSTSGAGQGRFRLVEYDPSPGIAAPPPVNKGTGPYSSLYRATQGPRDPTPSSMVSESSRAGPSQPAKRQKAPQPKPQAKIVPATSAPSSSQPVGPYYRRNYEQDPTFEFAYSPQQHSADFGANGLENARQRSEETMSGTVISIRRRRLFKAFGIESQSPSASRRVVKHQVRMITVLIQDIRSGETDHQLAEVKVPLRPTDDPRDGFWADSKDICNRLQSSPSRIDGPARVYTLRGKYRQFLLRVTEDNVDQTVSSNVIITPERTLVIVVEMAPQPGVRPEPPRIPREMLQSRSPSPQPSVEPLKASAFFSELEKNIVMQPTSEQQKRKREYSPSYDPDQGSSAGSSKDRMVQPSKMPRIESEERPKVEYEPLEEEDEEEDLFQAIVQRVDTALQKESDWLGFFQALGRPRTVANVLDQYRFVQKALDKYVGSEIPGSKINHIVEPGHIIAALTLEDEAGRYATECTATLSLLQLYGPEGTRLRDPAVMDMIADESNPIANAKPIKRLLRLLREIHENFGK